MRECSRALAAQFLAVATHARTRASIRPLTHRALPLPLLLLPACSITRVSAYTGEKVPAPLLTVVPEVGKPAQAIYPNIFAGKVRQLLTACRLHIGVASAQYSASSSTFSTQLSGRLLTPSPLLLLHACLSARQDVIHGMDRTLTPYGVASLVAKAAGRRHLLQSTMFNRQNNAMLASSNTQAAIRAAARGQVPVSTATRIGSLQSGVVSGGSANNAWLMWGSVL